MNEFDRVRLAAHDTLRSEAFENLSPAEINSMSLSTYARLTGRPTAAEAAHAALRAQQETVQPQAAAQQTVESPEPQGLTLEEMALTDPAAFAQWRASRTSSGEGVGLLNQGGQSWAEAAQARAGRTAMAGHETHAVVGRAFVPEAAKDPRSAQARFYTPGNSYQG